MYFWSVFTLVDFSIHSGYWKRQTKKTRNKNNKRQLWKFLENWLEIIRDGIISLKAARTPSQALFCIFHNFFTNGYSKAHLWTARSVQIRACFTQWLKTKQQNVAEHSNWKSVSACLFTLLRDKNAFWTKTFSKSMWTNLNFSLKLPVVQNVFGLLGTSKLQMFYKIEVLKNFSKFIEKHLCWSLFSIKLQGWGLQLY